ncbi:uncharacterized protein LOC126698334 [Quercus robur]|uniref:uncharacterized protein LOC126698334 n=1 Tax=Quercus robur TaxID=38942 RepID=UPI00216123E5|nr:uncharacterized protein LOC126698334 [Quercus robur]XP_050251441.1 uncharacterized protein LOC126698334 [Quercus robur]
MAKVSKVRRKTNARNHGVTRSPSPSCCRNNFKDVHLKKRRSKASDKKDWKNATCPVCLEYPHNAVLLLCSSYNKGCRTFMCATSHRYSNCLEQYKKAYTKVTPIQSSQHLDVLVENSSLISGLEHHNEKMEVPELLCPLCRGQVKGWTVVEPARKYLNAKKRSCMLDDCSFVGTYKQLRKHVRSKHPLACPRAVDPVLKEKWKRLEREREQSDVISTIISSTPGAVVLGDYVLEPNYGDTSDSDLDDYFDDAFFPLASFDRGRTHGIYSRSRNNRDHGLFDGDFVHATAVRSAASYGRGVRSAASYGRGVRSAASYGHGERSLQVARSRRQWRRHIRATLF